MREKKTIIDLESLKNANTILWESQEWHPKANGEKNKQRTTNVKMGFQELAGCLRRIAALFYYFEKCHPIIMIPPPSDHEEGTWNKFNENLWVIPADHEHIFNI